VHCAAAQYEQALPLLEQAIAIKRQHRSGGHTNVGLAFSLICRACLQGDRGQFAQAHASFDEAIACIPDVTHEIGTSAHGWRSAVLLWQGRWQEAREAAEMSGRIAEATRSLSQLSIARAMGAYAEWMLTRRPEHLDTLLEALAWVEPRESRMYRSFYHGWLADGLVVLGRRGQARSHAARAIQRAREGDPLGLAMAYRALARDATSHRPERVEAYIRLALQAARRRGSAHEIAVTQLCAAQIAWQQRQGPLAHRLLEEATGGFSLMQMPWHLQQASELRERMEGASGG
jgi:tetratricopeptide (TPR) repeat protein